MKKLILSISTIAFLISCSDKNEKSVSLDNMQWIDLTYAFDSTTLYWPNNVKNFEHFTDAEGVTPLGFYYSSYSICTPEHGGTHLDAPIHFAANKETVDQIPLNNLIGNFIAHFFNIYND